MLDACAIFEAFACGGWKALCARYELVVPSIVVRREAIFYFDADGRRISLDLPALVIAGVITEYAATAAELADTSALFHPEFRPRLQDGELEALTYLRIHQPGPDTAFVTADGPAIEAVVLLGMSDRVISLASAFRSIGATKKLDSEFTDDFVKRKIREGGQRLATGRGLAKPD